MKRCTKCGNETSMEGRFCEKCGGEMIASGKSGGGLKGSLSSSDRASSTSSFEGSSMSPSAGSAGGSSLFTRPDGGPSSAGSSPMSSSSPSLPPAGSSPTSPPPVGSPTGSSLFSSPSDRSSAAGSPPMGSSPMGSSPMGSSPMDSSPTSSPPIGSPPVSPPPVGPTAGSPLVGSPPVGHPPAGPSTTYLEEKMKSIKRKMKITKVLAGVALLLVIVIAVMIFTREPEYASTLTPEQIFEQNADAVFQVFGTMDGHSGGSGSAFFICSTGIAVTNHHVMYPWPQAIAILHDGRKLNITGFYSYDLDNDLAIIQVEGDGFVYTTLGDSDTLAAGAAISVIGSPLATDTLGIQHNTIKEGVVTTFIEEPFYFNGYVIPGLIQLPDFMIFGGNSGGPVFNDRGEVIGVSVATSSSVYRFDDYGNIVGLNTRHIGFAVPINRLDSSDIQGRQLSSLPIATSVSARTGDVTEHFPGVPNFLSVSNNAKYIRSGPAANFGLEELGFERVYHYQLSVEHFDSDAVSYERVLVEQGFIPQGNVGVSLESGMEFYYYHPTQDISVITHYNASDEFFVIAIGSGNIFENIHGGN